jgi:hypothetical protein
MASRARSDIGCEDLADALDSFAQNSGKTLLVYDNSKKVTEAKCDLKLIAKSHDLLSVLHKASSGKLSFKRTVVEGALRQIVRKHGQHWKLDEEHFEDWVSTHTCRVMNICRVVSQACLGSKHPRWVESLPWFLDKSTDDTKTKMEYIYGFDPQTKQAYRTKSNDKKKRKDFGSWDEPTENLVAAAVATWPDGDIKTISQVSMGDLKSWRDTHKSGGAAKDVWCGEHSATHHKLVVRPRKDRKFLMSLFEQAKQICQVTVQIFAQPGEETEGSAAEDRAAAFMKQIAIDYAADKIPAEKLHQEKDSRLKAAGLKTAAPGKKKQKTPSTSTTAVKRPAAAEISPRPAKKPSAAETAEDDEEVDSKGEAVTEEAPSENDDENEDDEKEDDEDNGTKAKPTTNATKAKPTKKQPARKRPAASGGEIETSVDPEALVAARLLRYLPQPPEFTSMLDF